MEKDNVSAVLKKFNEVFKINHRIFLRARFSN